MVTETSILVAVDGSANSDRAVGRAIELARSGLAGKLHLVNVQPPLGGAIRTFVGKADIEAYHREEGEKALESAKKLCAAAGVACEPHISVGRPGTVVSEFARRLGCSQIVIGTRGHTGFAGVLMGSVAQDVLAHADVPVCLVK